MLPTKFRFIWLSSFREEDFQKSTNQKPEWPVVAIFINGWELNEQSLQKTFQGRFLPNFNSIGQAVTENMGRPNINVHFETNLFEHFCVFQNNLNF